MSAQESTVDTFMSEYLELKEAFLAEKHSFFDEKTVISNIKLIDEGKYVISDDIWTLDEKSSAKFITAILDLTAKTAPDYAKNVATMKKVLSKKASAPMDFTMLVLTNNHRELGEFSTANSLSMDFITFIAIFIGYPYREAVAGLVGTKTDLGEIYSGYCPVCGHWPAMSYLSSKEGKRHMACISCGTFWQFKRVKCNFCLNENKDELSYLSVEGETAASAYTCESCHRYLKVVRIDGETIDFPKETAIVDFMSTGYLDLAAMQNQYLQESVLSTRFEGPEDSKIDEFYQGHTKH